MRYHIGTKVFGDWEIVAELGEGSFGKVFRLEKNTYKVKANSALKVLTVPRSSAEIEDAIMEGYDERSVTEQFHEVVEKLVDEIAVMAELKSHPNIVSIEDYTVIEHQDTIGWDILIRMELLTPLQSYQRQNPMEEDDVRKLARDICEALVFCQTKKLIHRDIKPGNVFVDSMGHFKLGDFGVARTAEKTISNMSKQGTENYMAPEVYFGRDYGSNVDIYSLGMMLYRLMNKNRLPFYPLPPAFPKYTEKENALVRRLKGEALPAPCDASEEFAAIILKACEADPRKRYQTASEMLADFNSPGSLGGISPQLEKDDWDVQEDDEELLEINHYSREFLEWLECHKGEASLSFENEEYDFGEDSLDQTVGTIDVAGGRVNTKIELRDNTGKGNEKGGLTSGLEQYLLKDLEEDGKENRENGDERELEWREESTDKMRDHTIHHEVELDEDDDSTISVFRGGSNIRKNNAVKKPITKTVDSIHSQDSGKGSLADDSLAEGSLAELNLSVRTYNILKRAGIETMKDLCSRTLVDVRAISGMGPKSVDEVLTQLMEHGLKLSTGKSMIQQKQEEKRQWTLEYWKWKLPMLYNESAKQVHGSIIEKEKGSWIYFAPDIPASICASAITNITQNHMTVRGVNMIVTNKNTKWVKKEDILGILDVSIEREACKRGIVVTEDYLFMNLGGTGKGPHNGIVIPYKTFSKGYTEVVGGLLKLKRTVLCWTSTEVVGVQRYDSPLSALVDYNQLIQCLSEVAEVHRELY